MSKWTEKEKALFRELWETRDTVEQIAKKLNRPKDSVRGYISRQKLETREKAKTSEAPIIKVSRNWFRDEIEDPPKEIPLPEDALNIPWDQLSIDQCQFGTSNDFYEPAGSKFICCGLQVMKGKGVRKRFCEYHAKYALKS